MFQIVEGVVSIYRIEEYKLVVELQSYLGTQEVYML